MAEKLNVRRKGPFILPFRLFMEGARKTRTYSHDDGYNLHFMWASNVFCMKSFFFLFSFLNEIPIYCHFLQTRAEKSKLKTKHYELITESYVKRELKYWHRLYFHRCWHHFWLACNDQLHLLHLQRTIN